MQLDSSWWCVVVWEVHHRMIGKHLSYLDSQLGGAWMRGEAEVVLGCLGSAV